MYKTIKKNGDFILSLVSLILLSPLFAILALWIKLDSKGSVFFKQKRMGLNKKEFNIIKFRTMYTSAPSDLPTHMLSDPDRFITKSGTFLRKTSLDELPQLINIFRGEMSFVGPRPALWNQYDLINERDKYNANGVVPGLTGWAQINGRDELLIENKAVLDGEYIEKMSLLFDLKCLLLTVLSVFKSEGVVEGGTSKSDKKDCK